MNLKTTRFPLQTIFVEVISIILGVVLALSVNEWRESKAQERQARAALSQIHEEVRSNLKLISTIHTSNIETLALLHQSEEAGEDTERQFVPGIQVNSTAWETANSIGVFGHVEYDKIIELSRLYSIQDIYRRYGFSFIEALMNGTSVAAANGLQWNESQAIVTFESSLNLLVELESALLDMYDEVLKVEFY